MIDGKQGALDAFLPSCIVTPPRFIDSASYEQVSQVLVKLRGPGGLQPIRDRS